MCETGARLTSPAQEQTAATEPTPDWLLGALRLFGLLYLFASASAALGLATALAKETSFFVDYNELARRLGTIMGGVASAAYFGVAGSNLRALKRSGRNLAAVAPALALLAIPVGTLIGATVLCLLFCKPAGRVFAADAAPNSRPTSNYLVRHWRGDSTLATAYWINGGLVTVIGPALLKNLGGALLSNVSPGLQRAAWLLLFAWSAALVVLVWSYVGIWRSAGKHQARGGWRVWAFTARALVLMSGAFVPLVITSPLVRDMGRDIIAVAMGNDPLGAAKLELSEDRETLVFDGPLAAGSTQAVQRVLRSGGSPVLWLESPGGRIAEAIALARLIRRHNLDTYVEGECDSACTIAFLSGRERMAARDAKLGFHRSSIAGTHAEILSDAEARAAYLSAGLSEPFIQRVLSTSAQTLWFPTRRELWDNGVVTRWMGMDDEVLPTSDAVAPKVEVARELLRRGSVDIHLDPRQAGVAVPPNLRSKPHVVLQVGYDMPVPIPDLRVDDAGVAGTLSFDSRPFACIVPWSAVFALVDEKGKGMRWPESTPADLESADR